VFEFVTPHLGSQGTICGGGRYDDLMAQMGGKASPAVGWGLGIERVLELLKELKLQAPEPAPDAYAVISDLENAPRVMLILQALRTAGISVQMHASSQSTEGYDAMASFKSQFKRADSSGARHALVFGADELADNSVTVKPLREIGGAQQSFSLSDIEALISLLKN
jgi:histidyl-tRNA synthetase